MLHLVEKNNEIGNVRERKEYKTKKRKRKET